MAKAATVSLLLKMLTLAVGAITAQSSPGVKKVKRSQCHSKYSCSDCKTAQICKPLDEGFLRPLSKVRCPNFCDSSVGTCVDYFPMNCESDGYCPKESYCRDDETSVSCQWNKVEEAFKFVKAQKCENYSTCSKTTGKCVPLTCSSEYTCLDDNTLVACNKNDEGLYTVVDKVACTGLTPFCNRWLGGCVSEENRNVSLITQCPNEHTCLSDNILIHCERNENGTYFAKSNEKCGGSTPFCNAWLGSCVSEENRGLSLFSKCSSHHSCLNEKTLLVCEYNKNHTYVLRQKVKCEQRTPFCNAWLGACVSEENRALGPLAACPTENVCLNDHILLNCKENGNGTFVLHSKVKCTGSTPYCNAWLGSCTKPEYLNISETSCPTENICVNEELLLSCKKNENGTYMEDRRVTCGGQNPFCNAWLGSCVSEEIRNITEKSVCSAEYTCVNDNIIVNCKKNENGIYEVDNKVICGGQTPFCNAWLGSCVSAENRNISETSSCSAKHTCVNNNILLNCKKGGNGTYFVNSKVNCGGETPFCNAFLGSCVSVKSRALVISAPCSAENACVNENLLLKCHLNENGTYVVDNKESCGGQTPFCNAWLGSCVAEESRNISETSTFSKEHTCVNDNLLLNCKKDGNGTYVFDNKESCGGQTPFCNAWLGSCVAEESRNISETSTFSAEQTCVNDNLLLNCKKEGNGTYVFDNKVSCGGPTPFCNAWLGSCVAEESRNISETSTFSKEHTCVNDNLLLNCKKDGNGTYVFDNKVSCRGQTPFCNAWLGSCVAEESRNISETSTFFAEYTCVNDNLLLNCKKDGNGTYVFENKVSCGGPTPFCNAWLGSCVAEESRNISETSTFSKEHTCVNDNLLLNCKKDGNGTYVFDNNVSCGGPTPFCNAWLGSCVAEESRNISETLTFSKEHTCVNDNLLLNFKKDGNGTYVFDNKVSCGGPTPFCNAWLGSCVSEENRNITEKSVCSAEYTCVNDNIIVNCKKNENGIYEVDNKVICGGQTPFCNAWLGSCVSAENRNISETSSCSAKHTCVNNNILLNCKKGGNGTYFVNSKVNCGGETPFCNAFLGSCVSVKSRALVISAPCSADHACVNENLLLKCHLNENGSYVVDNKESCGGQTPFCNAWLGSCVAEESRNISETSTFSKEHTCVNDNLLLNCKKDGNGTYVFDNKVSCGGQTPFCNAWLGSCVAEESRNISETSTFSKEHTCVNDNLLLNCKKDGNGTYVFDNKVSCGGQTPFCNAWLGSCVAEESRNISETSTFSKEHTCVNDNLLLNCKKDGNGTYVVDNQESCGGQTPFCNAWLGSCVAEESRNISETSTFSKEHTCVNDNLLLNCKKDGNGTYVFDNKVSCGGQTPFCNAWLGSCVAEESRNISETSTFSKEHTCVNDNLLLNCKKDGNGTYVFDNKVSCGGQTPFCNAWLGSCVAEESRNISETSTFSKEHTCVNDNLLLNCKKDGNGTYVFDNKVSCGGQTPFCNAWLGSCVAEESRNISETSTFSAEHTCVNDNLLLNCKKDGNGTYVFNNKVSCGGQTPFCNAWLGSCVAEESRNISETSTFSKEHTCVNDNLLLNCKKDGNGTYVFDNKVSCGGQTPFCNAWLGSCVAEESRNISETSTFSKEHTCVNDNLLLNCKKDGNGTYVFDNKVSCGGPTPFYNAWLGSCVAEESRNISETSTFSKEHTCVNDNLLLNCKKDGNGTYVFDNKVSCGGPTPFCNAWLGSCVAEESRNISETSTFSKEHTCVNDNLLLNCKKNGNGTYVFDNKVSCGGPTPFCNAWLGSCVAEESRNISETSNFSAEHTCVNDNLLLNCKKDGNGTYVFDNKVSCRGQTPFCNAWLGTCVAEETRNLSSLTSCTSEYSCLNGHLLLVCNRSESGNYTVNRLVQCLNKTLCNSTLGQCVPKIAATPKLVVIPNQHTEEDKKVDNNLLKTIVCPNEIYCKDDYTLVVCNKTDSGDYEIWREERCPKTRPTCDKLTNACIPLAAALETYIPQGNKSIGCNSIFSCADCKTLRVCKPSLSGALEHYKDTVCYGERPFCDRHIGSCVDRQPLECGEKDNLICTEDGAYPDNDCTAYHICKGGIPNKFSCGKNRSFNPRKGVCEEGGECGKFRCAKGQDGFKSAHSIYNEYYAFCSSEHLLISKCHNHLRFNVTMQRCEAACSKDGELLVHPSDCHRFVICREGIVHGKPYFFREIGVCPEGQAFQPGHSTCVDQNLVKGCSTSKPTVWTEDLAALMKEAGALEGKAETLLTGRQASATPIREGLFSFGQGLLKGDEAEAAGWAVPVTLTRANTRSLAVYRNPTCKGIFSCLDCSTLQICTPGENSTWQPKASVKCGQATPYCDPDVGSCVAYQPNACTAPSNFVCVTDGIFPDQNCRRFQVCRNLKSRMYECSQNDTVFDPRRERCVLGGPCGQFQCDPQAAGGYTVPHSAYPEYAGLCEEEHGIKLVYKCHGNNRLNVTSQRCEPLCREDGERISDPDDCRKYYECREFWKASVRGFEKQSKTCPPGTAFHPKFSFCFQEHEVVACRSSKAHPPLYHNHRKRIASSNQTAVI